MTNEKEAAIIIAAMQMAVRVHEATTPIQPASPDSARSELLEEFAACFNELAALLTPTNAAKPIAVIRSGKHNLYGSRDK